MPRSALRLFSICLLFGLLFYFSSKSIFADTTPYRSAATITTDNISGNTSNKYTDLSNCSATDGLTCNRALGLGAANLYFQNFGDFGIPSNTTIIGVRIRVTGKSDISTYAGVSVLGSNPGIPFPANCQDPSDKWTMTSLVSQNVQTYNAISTSGVDFINCLNAANIRSNNFIFRINRAGPTAWSANIDNLEIAFDYQIAPSPTPTPSPSPSPTSTPPPPFLDLPWNYEAKGLSFNEAALNINSFFDHEYPLLSTGLPEPNESNLIVLGYDNIAIPRRKYTKHDGYDYGTPAKVEYGDPVLATAEGIATYVNTCGACGNAIHIDHGNGYQTRYYHLQENGLLTNVPGQKVHVSARQEIGKVGATGNVDPPGEAGAHIHFMVIQDKNHDGNFEDNIPDGLIDPFGWQSTLPDPWENYSFFYNGQNRTGNKSFYLWKEKIDELNSELTSNGGIFKNGKTTVTFQPNSTLEKVLLYLISTPAKEFSNLISLGSNTEITAQDSAGNNVSNFNLLFELKIDFSNQDLSRYLVDTLSIYSSSDGIDWVKEPTIIDLNNKTAITQLNHLTNFALMGERKDSMSAVTTPIITGDKGENDWYRSNVLVSLNAVDNQNGLGVGYILYKKDDEDWKKYENPISFLTEGKHTVEFYSVDNDENIEARRSIQFFIDKTPPEAEIYYSIASKRIEFIGKDNNIDTKITSSLISGNQINVVSDNAGNKITLTSKIFSSSVLNWINTISGKYNSNSNIIFDKNNFVVAPFYNPKTKQLESITEIYTVKDKNLITVIFNISQNKTKIYTYDKQNKQILKEELTGEHLLKLYTEKGTLKYRY